MVLSPWRPNIPPLGAASARAQGAAVPSGEGPGKEGPRGSCVPGDPAAELQKLPTEVERTQSLKLTLVRGELQAH